MEATRLLPSTNSLCKLRPTLYKYKRNHLQVMVAAARRGPSERDNYWGGSNVDEDMIVLRKKIKEMKMSEMCDDDQLPSNWMDWEKRYYAHYNQDVCEAIGLLQNYLMSVRPSLAIGTLAFVMLSMLISSGVLVSHALEIVKLTLHLGLMLP